MNEWCFQSPEQQGELMNLEEGVQQLIDMFGVGKNEAILRLERNQGNLESAIEEYFTVSALILRGFLSMKQLMPHP